jgi:hypothetical protein
VSLKFLWNGQEFRLAERWTFAEIDHVERLTKLPMDDWSKTMSARANVFWSVRRVDPQLLSWEQLGELGPDEFEFVDEPEDADADPPAPSPNDPPGTPDGSSATSEPSTSSTSPATSESSLGISIG